MAGALWCSSLGNNWMKVHGTLRVTPAMQAGLADRVFDMSDLVALIEQAEAPMPADLSESA
jgi:hypothetical protein